MAATQPMVEKEFQKAYMDTELELLDFVDSAIKKLPVAYVYLMLSFRANDMIRQMAAPLDPM